MARKVQIKLDDQVIAYRSGTVLELSTATGGVKVTEQLDKDHYINLATGEIKEINHSVDRSLNLNSLSRTFRNIRRLVLNNFKAGDFWLTLTYAQPDGKPMTDSKRVYADFQKFWRKFKANYGPNLDYFCCS